MIGNTINDAVTMSGGEGALLANRYRVVRQLGAGGMGSVWLAEDTQLDNARYCRSADRKWSGPGCRIDFYGFRLCCDRVLDEK